MLQHHTRGLGRIVALALAATAIVPAAAVAKPADDPVSAASPKAAISQDLVSPDARDAGTVGGAGIVSSQSLVSPDAKDVAAGRIVGAEPAPAPAPVESTGGVDGWDIEVILGLAAAALMGVAGIGLLARVRLRRPRTHTLA